uniref:Uncharacterized protein n=1 Tax=Cacopsylla melanoneura TaxID=428564 RepID=A0A8D8ZEE5_9HEMI
MCKKEEGREIRNGEKNKVRKKVIQERRCNLSLRVVSGSEPRVEGGRKIEIAGGGEKGQQGQAGTLEIGHFLGGQALYCKEKGILASECVQFRVETAWRHFTSNLSL